MKDYNGDVVTAFTPIKWWRDQFFREDGLQFLVVIGPPGSGKSRLFRDHKSPHTLYLGGSLSAFHLYTQLYIHLDDLVVIDDVDSFFKDKAAVNLLKCLCNTDANRTVYWGKRNKQLEDEGIPTSFTTRSRVCILANTLTSIEENLAAVLDRAFIVQFRPTVHEVHAEVSSWMEDKEVYNFIGEHLNLVTEPSMRQYVHAVKMKSMGGDWRDWLLRRWVGGDSKLSAVAQIMNDAALKSADERVQRFSALTGGSRATYMRMQAKWKQLTGGTQRGSANRLGHLDIKGSHDVVRL